MKAKKLFILSAGSLACVLSLTLGVQANAAPTKNVITPLVEEIVLPTAEESTTPIECPYGHLNCDGSHPNGECPYGNEPRRGPQDGTGYHHDGQGKGHGGRQGRGLQDETGPNCRR